MKPKEKAKELFDKMSFETHKYNAIHCALIAVDEIIKYCYKDDIKYWQQVKQEIEKL
jgi:hypothetical protein